MSRLILSLVAFLVMAAAVPAQELCPAPPDPTLSGQSTNLFSDEQETILGEAVADHMEGYFRVIDDPELVGYIDTIGRHIAAQMTPLKVPLQFFLVDLPVPNAFALPGRIYVSRKLVQFARSEDELAGVLAHELGHEVSHQSAINVSELLESVLGVTEVTDRADIYEKYHQLIESWRRQPKAFRRVGQHGLEGEIAADRLALDAVTRAGYSPEAFVEFFDRLAQTEGQTGNWLTDFFGTTKPNARRLGEMLDAQPALPPVCVASPPARSDEQFRVWQQAVVAYSGSARQEHLHNILARQKLDQPLRVDATRLKFSPDGNYLLAQDSAGLVVLSRDPFAVLFHVDAPEAYAAEFTPDSAAVVFHTRGLRVEKWSVAAEERTDVWEPVLLEGCRQSLLSPDGRFLGCLTGKYALQIIEVSSGEPIFEKTSFVSSRLSAEALQMIALGATGIDVIQMGFSPDSRYFVAVHGIAQIAFDLEAREEMKLRGRLRSMLHSDFAFLTPDRVAVVNASSREKSAVVAFPAGEVLAPLRLGVQALEASGDGRHLLLRPVAKQPVGAMDSATGKLLLASKVPGFDIHGDVFVNVLGSGDLGLFDATSLANGETPRQLATLALPGGHLGRPRAAALSPDEQWLALSVQNGGAVWNLKSGKRAFTLREFRSAAFDNSGILFADFPEFQDIERSILTLDPRERRETAKAEIHDRYAWQFGSYLVVQEPGQKEALKNVVIEVRDVHSRAVLWSRRYPHEAPRRFFDARLESFVSMWRADSDAVREQEKHDPDLAARLAGADDREYAFVLQVVGLRDGNVVGNVVVETGKGSFGIAHVQAAGDSVVVSDGANRLLVYSLSDGRLRGRLFAGSAVLDPNGRLLIVGTRSGKLDVYDLRTLERLDQFVFAYPVSFVQFSPDGKHLFALTADQTAFILGLSTSAGS